jgi:hypothetical protein
MDVRIGHGEPLVSPLLVRVNTWEQPDRDCGAVHRLDMCSYAQELLRIEQRQSGFGLS